MEPVTTRWSIVSYSAPRIGNVPKATSWFSSLPFPVSAPEVHRTMLDSNQQLQYDPSLTEYNSRFIFKNS